MKKSGICAQEVRRGFLAGVDLILAGVAGQRARLPWHILLFINDVIRL